MRAAIRVLMTLFVVGLIVFLALGYWAGSTWSRREDGAVGSSGTVSTADSARARRRIRGKSRERCRRHEAVADRSVADREDQGEDGA